MRMQRMIIVAVLAALAWTGIGRAELPPQQKLMARRAAEADAYRKLAERVLGLQVDSATTVRDFATENDRIASAMNHFIRSVRIEPDSVVWYDDGSCQVTAATTLETVVRTLKTVCDEHYDGQKWTRDRFEEIQRTTSTQVITEEGWGAATVETHMPEPASLVYVQPLVTHGARSLNLPAIYGRYPARERLRAKRAAELDAYRKLIERIHGLQISASTTVEDFITTSDQIRMATQHALRGMRTGEVRYQPDGIVQVQMSVTLDNVVRTLQTVCDERYDGQSWTREHFEQIRTNHDRRVITVVGMGALDSGYVTGGFATTPAALPNDPGIHRRTETERIVEQTTVIVLD